MRNDPILFAIIYDREYNQVMDLPINLTQVGEKLEFIKKAKATAFYEGATINDLESLRTELRGIMRIQIGRAHV